VDDYLATARAGDVSPRTLRFSYGFPLREVFLPCAAEQGIAEPTEHSIWTYVKAVNGFVRWLKEER